MKTHTAQPLLLYVSRGRLSFYFPENKTVQMTDLPAEIFADMEIISEELLETHLTAFFAAVKLTEREVIVVLAESVTFAHQLEHLTEGEEKEQEVREFSLTVPLESKYHKEIKIGKASEIVYVSRKLYQPLIRVLDKMSLHVAVILSQHSIEDAQIQEETLTPEVAEYVITNVDTLKKTGNFLTAEERPVSSVTNISQPSHTRELMLVGVFVALLFCLAGVYYWSQRADQTVVKTSPTPVATLAPKISPVPTLSPSPVASGSAEISQLTIEVVNGSGIPGQATQIKTALEAKGFSQITARSTEVTKAARSIITFHPTVRKEIQDQVLATVQEVAATISAQVSTEGTFDITISTHQTN